MRLPRIYRTDIGPPVISWLTDANLRLVAITVAWIITLSGGWHPQF